MFWFPYEYIKSSYILENFLKIPEYWSIEFLVLIIWIFIIFSIIFLIAPFFMIYWRRSDYKKEKIAKDKLKNKILLQKSLEDLIMREINEKNNELK